MTFQEKQSQLAYHMTHFVMLGLVAPLHVLKNVHK